MSFPLFLTAAEAAERLGVGAGRVTAWAGRGLLRIAGQSEGGDPLFREHVIADLGERLAGSEVPDEKRLPRKARPALWGDNSPPLALDCGCMLSGRSADPPHFLCREAHGLDLARRLTAAFMAAMPDDPFFVRLAAVTQDALERHIAPLEEQAATLMDAAHGRSFAAEIVRGMAKA